MIEAFWSIPFPLLKSGIMPVDPGRNMAVSLALSGLAFLITLIIGRPIVTYLRRFRKKNRPEVQEIHGAKAGTPTMGGIMIAVTTVLLTAVFGLHGRLSMLLPISVLLLTGTLGAIDDRMNLMGRKGEGLQARFKMLWLGLVALATALALHLPDPFGLGLHNVYVPFLGQYDMGRFYFPIAAFAIIAMANAVNLTDGLDTLAGGTGAIAFVSYGIIAYMQGQVAVVTLCFIIVGSLMGFLWFNAHPAQVFMGDAGSLAIGATLATVAFMTGQWLLLPIVGLVFVAETVSVIMQVAYFKATKGKRIFKMTPLHHHFELLGWSETQVTMRFWMFGMMVGLLGVALALL